MTDSLVPLRDRVLVLRDVDELRTEGGLHLPEVATERPAKGRVVAVGDGRTLESGLHLPMTVKEGDHVVFGKYSGVEMEVSNVTYLILREDEIIGVFRPKAQEQAA